VDDWYEIGITVGLGVAAGVLFAGLLARRRFGVWAALAGALVAGAALGLVIESWSGLAGAVVGAAVGAVSAAMVARGALRRGATSGGTAVLLGGAAAVVALLALIPIVGYLLAVAVPALAVRRARREPERHAGLRSLAR
jgi:hypothetical protein